MSISFEVKSQLAKLLATENITMQHNPAAKTASFDIKNRHLTLPVWQNISEDLYDMLVVHEVGHALDTPLEGWLEAINEIANKHHTTVTERIKISIKDFLNVIEDARIDKRQKRRYPGSRINYVRGYKELHEKNFFGVSNKDVNGMSFIDRINLYYKSHMIKINFTPEERVFLHRIDDAETFHDVVSITADIYGFCKKNDIKPMTIVIDHDDFDEFEMSSDEDSDSDDEFEMEVQKQESASDSDADEFGDDGWDSDSDSDSDSDDSDSNEQIQSNPNGAMAGSEGNDEDFVPTSETEEAARKANSTIVMDSDANYVYYMLPVTNHQNIVDDFSVVIPQIENSIQNFAFGENFNKAKVSASFNVFRNQENSTISYMVKEFEMKKAADAYARTSIAKTGVIDTNKLHTYRYNDDIFRRISTVSQGKNHGFIMLLDWSGSMIGDLKATIKQLFSLVFFCKRVGVPFEVYMFRDICNSDGQTQEQFIYPKGAYIHFERFKLRNILSSRMSNDMLNRAFLCLWFRATTKQEFPTDIMNGTPLNQAIFVFDKLVNDFQTKNKLQVVNTIVLTDGVSDSVYTRGDSYVYGKKTVKFIQDPVTKKIYNFSQDTNRYGVTRTFLKILKDRTNCNLIGYFIHNGSLRHLSYMVDGTVLENKENVKIWRAHGFIETASSGYDQYYIMNTTRLDGLADSTGIVITPDMKKHQIAKEFTKMNGQKNQSRLMLKKFMDNVTKPAA
jgi:hypothetical protein